MKFVITLLAPFILIILGAGIAALGFWFAWFWVCLMGLIIAGIGLIWVIIIFLWYSPLDLLP